MPKAASQLEWCIVRLGEDHNWWVEEVSDPVRWDVDGLSIIDPRQVQHIVDLVEAMVEYGFDRNLMERAFLLFRIDRDLGSGRVHLTRVKDSLFDSEDKLFALPDLLDEENGPYADFLDHITRVRVKMLNNLFDFEQKLTVDEVEDEIREAQNIDFMEGKAVHVFTEIMTILDYTPEGWETEEEGERKPVADEDKLEDADLPVLNEEEEQQLKNDQSLKWDEEDEGEEEEEEKGKDGDSDGKDNLEEADEGEDKPPRSGRKRR